MNEDPFYLWWIIAVLIPILGDMNLMEFLYCWLGWQYRERLTGSTVWDASRRAWLWMSRRPLVACLLIATLPVIVRIALIPIFPIPQPIIADEFSHLLLADTFRHGRLTNPTHPLWQHFESIHIFHKPTYNSMYFPSFALWLAAGWLIGNPYFGVLLCTACMCGSIVWALQPFLTWRWAILAGVLVGLRLGIVGYWANSYWGGSLGALGGALVVGSYARLRNKPIFVHSLLLGLGLSVLATFRPLEGLFFSLPFAVALAWKSSQQSGNRFLWFLRATAPACAIVLVALCCLAIYFKNVTGDYFTPGYVTNQKQYGWPLTLPWQKPETHTFRHREMQQYFEWEKTELKKKTSLAQILTYTPVRVVGWWTFFFGPTLTFVVIHLRKVVWSRRMRVLIISGGACFTIVLLETGYPHYLSPATVCIMAVIVQCIRWARTSSQGWLRGPTVIPAILSVISATVATRVLAEAASIPYLGTDRGYLTWCCVSTAWKQRETAEREVGSHPGKHIVFVTYDHPKWESREWVFNGADIDSNRIIWARDMGKQANRELLDYYPDRHPWTFFADTTPPRVVPYVP